MPRHVVAEVGTVLPSPNLPKGDATEHVCVGVAMNNAPTFRFP